MSLFKNQTLKISKQKEALKNLTEEEVRYLFDAVYTENEGFDGEQVEAEYMAEKMERRFKIRGLTPPREL